MTEETTGQLQTSINDTDDRSVVAPDQLAALTEQMCVTPGYRLVPLRRCDKSREKMTTKTRRTSVRTVTTTTTSRDTHGGRRVERHVTVYTTHTQGVASTVVDRCGQTVELTTLDCSQPLVKIFHVEDVKREVLES